MLKKLAFIIFAAVLCAPLAGCSDDARIDRAAMAQAVTVRKTDGGADYTFYTLSSDDEGAITVNAQNFEEAAAIAKDGYAPNLSLARLEILIYEDKIGFEFMQRDFEYISADYRLSPLITVALADERAFEGFAEKSRSFEALEEQIILLKNENADIDYKLLSVYNKNKSDNPQGVIMPYITGEGQMKCEILKISSKKQ